ncbi:MAG TPA: ATP-dependent 6-phosphofructokinase [Candidatus Sulfotelmatobacter sp.]|nr:ATP-dependent 6-phosphofructokinase [Candidatus Sulfotelmatobacter sp.]
MAKRIGILTSGGDCAGLNAVIRAIVLHAQGRYGWEVVGIREGTQGLLDRPPRAETLGREHTTGLMLRLGGTVLGTTNRGDPFAYPMADGTVADRSQEVIEGVRALGLDAVIGIGGDGSFRILDRLARQGGFPLIGIPKTIDNDLGLTEMSIGYNTAVGVATEALDRLQPTAASHSRVMVLEVMGRDAGHIALAAGIAGGADVILIPEIPYRIDAVRAKIEALKHDGRNFALVVVAEAVLTEEGQHKGVQAGGAAGSAMRYGGIGAYLAERITQATGAETRVTVLGHVQRGSMPSWTDRMLASAFAVHAVDLIAAGKSGRMVAWSYRQVIDVPIQDAVAHFQAVDVDGPLVKTARGLGICLGDA